MAPETGTQDDGQQGGGHDIKLLRERAARVDESEAALAQATREIALLKSGVDVEHPVGRLFVKAYDGEATPEAIKEAAQEYGVPIRGEAAPAGTEVPEGTQATGTQTQEPAEPTGTEVRQLLAGQPVNAGEVTPDPVKTALDKFQLNVGERSLSWDEAAGQMFNDLVNAAQRGDSRVVIPDKR